MSSAPLLTFIRRLRQRIGAAPDGGLTDAQLVERFVARRDEAAFELLLWRHGPMVLGVCRRLLRKGHDVEDAFQATFLALVREAGSLRRRDSVAGWLYSVAYRVTLKLKASESRRARREAQGADLLPARPTPDPAWRDVRAALDDEVSRLPERYRVPFVLCCLEGRTREEAARQLGLPSGTVSSRLAWARRRLRARLGRRGLAVSAGLLVAALSPGLASASLPTALAQATLAAGLRFAADGVLAGRPGALARGVLRGMVLAKLTVVAGAVLSAGLLLVVGLLAGDVRGEAGTARPPVPSPADQPATGPEDWRACAAPRRHAGQVGAVAFAPDGRTLATAGPGEAGRGEVRLWDVTAARERAVVRLDGTVTALAFSADGRRLATGSSRGQSEAGMVQQWDAFTGREQTASRGHTHDIETLTFDAEERLWATGTERGLGAPHLLTLKTWTVAPAGAFGSVDTATAEPVAFSTDGSLRAIRHAGEADGATGPVVKLWDVLDQDDLCTLQEDPGPLVSLARAPGRRLVVTLSGPAGRRRILRWDTATGRPLGPLAAPAGRARVIALVPDGHLLAVAEDDAVRLWDAAGRPCGHVRTASLAVRTLAFSPDGTLLAAGGEDGNVWLWERRSK
jgi:RNA polymerase sigma factor (sigma-70 family)